MNDDRDISKYLLYPTYKELKIARKRLNISIAKVALWTEMAENTVRGIERGRDTLHSNMKKLTDFYRQIDEGSISDCQNCPTNNRGMCTVCGAQRWKIYPNDKVAKKK